MTEQEYENLIKKEYEPFRIIIEARKSSASIENARKEWTEKRESIRKRFKFENNFKKYVQPNRTI